MTDELELIRRKKMEELKKKYVRENDMKEESLEWPDKPVHMTDETLDSYIKKYDTVIVDCWAVWCAPCLMIAPIVEELAKELKGKVVFGKLNVDENQMTAAKYGIMSIPTLLVFKNGKLVDRIIGAMPKPMLKAKLAQYI